MEEDKKLCHKVTILKKMILAVAEQRVLQEKKESWNFGWQFKEYRRSKKAYLDHNENKSVIFTQKGLIIYENVVSQLLKQKNIQKLWDKQELWGVIASLIATLPIEASVADLKREISERLSLVFDESYEIVAFPIANIKWETSPLGIGDMVIGKVDQNWVNKISKCAGGRPVINFTEKIRWLSLANSEKSPINAIAIWVQAKGIKGREEAFTKFDNLIDTVLCFFKDHEKNELYSMRGNYNRPGVRGIVALSGCSSGPEPTASHSGGYCLNKGSEFQQMGAMDDWPSCESFCSGLAKTQNASYENNKNWNYGFKFISGSNYCYCTLCS